LQTGTHDTSSRHEWGSTRTRISDVTDRGISILTGRRRFGGLRVRQLRASERSSGSAHVRRREYTTETEAFFAECRPRRGGAQAWSRRFHALACEQTPPTAFFIFVTERARVMSFAIKLSFGKLPPRQLVSRARRPHSVLEYPRDSITNPPAVRTACVKEVLRRDARLHYGPSLWSTLCNASSLQRCPPMPHMPLTGAAASSRVLRDTRSKRWRSAPSSRRR